MRSMVRGTGSRGGSSSGGVGGRGRIFLPISVDEFFVGAGSPSAGSTSTAHRVPHVLFDAAATELIFWQAADPGAMEGWNTADVYVWTITVGATASNNVALSAGLNVGATGEAMGYSTEAVGTAVTTVAITGGGDGLVKRSQLTTALNLDGIAAEYLMQPFVPRVGGDAADTYAADIGIIGIDLVKAS